MVWSRSFRKWIYYVCLESTPRTLLSNNWVYIQLPALLLVFGALKRTIDYTICFNTIYVRTHPMITPPDRIPSEFKQTSIYHIPPSLSAYCCAAGCFVFLPYLDFYYIYPQRVLSLYIFALWTRCAVAVLFSFLFWDILCGLQWANCCVCWINARNV